MAINDDFQVYPASKVIRHVSGTSVYTAVQFYSWIQGLADEPGMMSYQEVIKYNTPTSFTMQNGWFLDNGDGSNILQYLSSGSIDTSGYATISDPVYMLDMDNAEAFAAFVSGDKDKRIEDDDTLVGPLLAYKNAYPGANRARIWVRDTRGTPAVIADNSKIDMSTDGGTGSGAAYGDSVSGDEIYCNIYTIADFPTNPSPQVYIYQKHPASTTRVRIAEWSAFTNWDRGSIDVLIPVKLGGSLIDSGLVKVVVRQTGDTFTFVDADLSSGSRTPVATETASDTVNVTKGEWYLLYDNEAGGGFTAADVIQNTSTGSGTPPSWYAEVVSVTDWGTSGLLVLRGLRGTIADNDAIYVSTTQRGQANGTPGDTYTTYDAAAQAPAAGDLGKPFEGGTSGAHRVLCGYQHDGPGGKLVLAVYHTHGTLDSQTYTGTGRDRLYKTLLDNDVLDAPAAGTGAMIVTLSVDSTTLISGYSDITIAHINGTVDISNKSGSFIPGERITWNAGASSAVYIKDTGSVMTLANVDPADEPDASDTFTGQISAKTADCDSGLTDANTATFAFVQQSAASYSVFVECGAIYETGRTLKDVYCYLQYYLGDGKTTSIYTSTGAAITLVSAEEYVKAVAAYAASKPAPFGTLAGSLFFGAQGVWLQGQAEADNNNLKLRDHSYNPQEPYRSVVLTVGNTRVSDDIVVFLRSGSLPDKTQYTSHNTANVQGDSTFERDATNFPIDTASAGTFFVVDTSAKEEHRYRYDSWSTTVLTLPTKRTSTATAASSGQTLKDTGATFVTWGIQRGDIIRNTTDDGWGYVVSVDSETQLTTTKLTTSGKDWAEGDGYFLNALVVTYDNTDKFYITYMDTIEDTGTDLSPGSATASVLYAADRNVLVRVRNTTAATKIQDFVAPSTIGETGMSVNVIRNEDKVFA